MITHPHGASVPLRISIQPSRMRVGFLLFAHIGAFICLMLSGLAGWMLGVGGGLLAISLGHEALQYRQSGNSDSVTMLGCSADGQWWLASGKQQQQPVELLPGSYLHPLLVVLHFRLVGGGRRRLLLLPDMFARDEMRRLRVVVRTGGLKTGVQGSEQPT